MATTPSTGAAPSTNAAAAAQAAAAREARLAAARAEAARRQAAAAKAAQQHALEARNKVQATQVKLQKPDVKPPEKKALTTQLNREKAELKTARADAVKETAKAQRLLATAEKTNGAAEAKARLANPVSGLFGADKYDRLEAKNQQTFDALFGAGKNAKAEATVDGLRAVNVRAKLTPEQVDNLRAELVTDQSGASRVAAAQKLEAAVAALPDAGSRTRLLEQLTPELQEISKGANGTPSEGDRKAILTSLVRLSENAGPAGAQVVASAFADVAVNDHTDVDNGDQLGGALKSVINDNCDQDIFGVALGNELGNREGLSEVRDNVRQGVYEAIHDQNPSKLDRVVDDIGKAWDEVKNFAAEKYLSVFNPVTGALDEEIKGLGPNDKFEANVGADIKAVLGVQVDLKLDILRKPDTDGHPNYTVGFTGRVEGEFGAKLKEKLPFLDKFVGQLGGEAEGNVHGAARAEFNFTSEADAEHAADTIARTTISAASPALLGATALAEGTTDGYSNLVSNLGAVEISAGVGTAASGEVGARGVGAELSAEANLDTKLRLEFIDGKPAVLSQSFVGSIEGSAQTDGSPQKPAVDLSKPQDTFGIFARGEGSATVKVENRVRIGDPENFKPKDLLSSNSVETVLSLEGTVAGGVQLKGARAKPNATDKAPYAGKATGVDGVRVRAEIRGTPTDLLNVAGALLDGKGDTLDRALGETREKLEYAPITIESQKHEFGIGPASVYFGTRHEDLGNYRQIIAG